MPEHTPAPNPARSLYGFFMYLFSKTLLGVYCLWAFIPDQYLHILNIYYYPQKYWATAIPIQCLVALTVFAFFIYPSSNMMLTPNIDSINTITDPCSHFQTKNQNMIKKSIAYSCVCREFGKCNINTFYEIPQCDESTVPLLYDLDIRYVCRKLYLNKST